MPFRSEEPLTRIRRFVRHATLLLIAGLVLATLFAPNHRCSASLMQRDATAVMVHSLKNSLATYKEDFALYPKTLQQLHLSHNGKYDYVLRPPRDSWKNEFIYRRDAYSPQGFVLYSRGENQIDEQGGGDDISGTDDAL